MNQLEVLLDLSEVTRCENQFKSVTQQIHFKRGMLKIESRSWIKEMRSRKQRRRDMHDIVIEIMKVVIAYENYNF